MIQRSVMTKKDLANIQYDSEKGYHLQDFYFDSLLDVDSLSLAIEDSINTDCGVLITWTLCEGWIVIPGTKDNLDYLNYVLLEDYLQGTINFKVATRKEEMINDYIAQLKFDVLVLEQHLNKQQGCMDELLLVIKEHRAKNTKNLKSLLEQIKSELQSWQNAKQYYLKSGLLVPPVETVFEMRHIQ